uniref:Preprotein-translocase subunit g n=1 Tax=Polysiphonia elongata TaxID=159753 RepID=A0A1Z1MBK1_9FLOR|nr:preprotein-translocase subunit g [Polysiphonia elongata]ARW63340.1 preprotein-translocase subunit g [Polysiphonia elongata]
MITKTLWYLSSLLVIGFILISNPRSNTLGSSRFQSKILNFRSSQLSTQKLITFFVFVFFLFTCLSLLST